MTVFVFLRAAEFDFALAADWKMAAWYLVLSVLAGVLGFLLGRVPGIFIIGPILYSRSKINGAPFAEGDRVQVIGGRYSGREFEVYSRWQGDSVRVRIGGKAAKTYGDVFGPTQLLRVAKAEQGSAPDASHRPS